MSLALSWRRREPRGASANAKDPTTFSEISFKFRYIDIWHTPNSI